MNQRFPIVARQSSNMAYSGLLIGTHNGKFHCDEVFACWMLKTLERFRGHSILRSRDHVDWEKCEVLVDVGGEFNHDRKRYDHHQKEFCETMRTLSITSINGKLKSRLTLQYDTKLSSAGLVYAFYGKEVLSSVLATNGEYPSNADLDFYYDRLYKHFVEAVDAVDNGIKNYEGETKYIVPVTIQSLVDDLNPAWNDKDADEDVRFSEAMELVGQEFTKKLLYLHKAWMPCKNIVQTAIEERFKVHKSGKIFVLRESCPWKQHLFIIEKEMDIAGELVFIIYPDSSGKYRVQAIPVSETSDFDNRFY